jgi:predicted transcriptional regulator
MAKVEMEVGTTLREALAEFGDAWKAHAAGKRVSATQKVSFVDWRAFSAVMTPKRYDLIRHLRREPAPSVRALARALERDVKRVHEDVVVLAALGLIDRDENTGALSTRLDKVTSTINFAA